MILSGKQISERERCYLHSDRTNHSRDAKTVRELLDYDSETGVFAWRKRARKSRPTGKCFGRARAGPSHPPAQISNASLKVET